MRTSTTLCTHRLVGALVADETVRPAFDETGVRTEFGYDDADGLFGDFEDKPYVLAESVDPTVAQPGGTTIEPAQ